MHAGFGRTPLNEPRKAMTETQTTDASDSQAPLAYVRGQAMTQLPRDLYIPPQALRVFLEEAFEGPLDLLLYLIRRQNLDILDIPVAHVTEQYMAYIEMMNGRSHALAAEYMVMAAMLAEIKSRMLLPRPTVVDEDEAADPRAELVRRLQEYERYKQAAEDLDALPRMLRDTFQATAEVAERVATRRLPALPLQTLLQAYTDAMRRAAVNQRHHISRERLSVRERMSHVISRLSPRRFTVFQSLFERGQGRPGVVVTFLAMLELVREGLIVVQQADSYSEIHLKIADRASAEAAPR